MVMFKIVSRVILLSAVMALTACTATGQKNTTVSGSIGGGSSGGGGSGGGSSGGGGGGSC